VHRPDSTALARTYADTGGLSRTSPRAGLLFTKQCWLVANGILKKEEGSACVRQ